MAARSNEGTDTSDAISPERTRPAESRSPTISGPKLFTRESINARTDSTDDLDRNPRIRGSWNGPPVVIDPPGPPDSGLGEATGQLLERLDGLGGHLRE